ncbi:hypothetical protein MBM_07120 [Drepanopeziza brunnea f. sp. 'multigermtubi' MB_m1]|uniref:Uncharacterized protein n=1 Tax=Marssonina brunnea f. sp. multigermtubi (strain MB_m1) TaxID=1072389 RepID=K1XQN0_MARBU|nr:uncharacterized protein MBM_07120 [Drepanopeziza brunnea f. sp. 'multigermtubi' MB_m1]EKD14909.1 hypothetical protein MBM_07120 [Drepanopeziza brunnea f. sp. 'multigermtubi' MB_m1]
MRTLEAVAKAVAEPGTADGSSSPMVAATQSKQASPGYHGPRGETGGGCVLRKSLPWDREADHPFAASLVAIPLAWCYILIEIRVPPGCIEKAALEAATCLLRFALW